MAIAATASWRQFGQRAVDPPDRCRRADGRRFGVRLPACRPSLADRHAYVFLRGAGLPRRLLRLPADPRRHRRGRAASSGAEFPAAGRDLSRRRRSRPRRASRRHPADGGRRPDLAGAASCRICSRRRREKTAEAEAANAAASPRQSPSASKPNSKAKQERDAARRELAAGFERKVGSIVEAVAVAAGEMQGLSSSMSSSNAETTRQTAAAAAASTQASDQCRDGGGRDRRTDRLDQQHRPAGDPLGRNRRQGRRRSAPHQYRGRGARQPAPRRSAKW